MCREEAAAACDCIYPPFRKKKKVTTAPHPPILFFKINKEKERNMKKCHDALRQGTPAGREMAVEDKAKKSQTRHNGRARESEAYNKNAIFGKPFGSAGGGLTW